MPVIYDNSVNEMNTLWLPTEDIDDEPVDNKMENCILRPSAIKQHTYTAI